MGVKVWFGGDEDLARWLVANTALAALQPDLERLPSPKSIRFTNLASPLQDILYLDAPDIILSSDTSGSDVPFLAIEFYAGTPHGQHPKQRFARLIAAAERSVACALVLPAHKRATVHGQPHVYHRGGDIFYAVVKLMDYHRVPAFIFDWPDQDGVLVLSSGYPSAPDENQPSSAELFGLVQRATENAVAGRPSQFLLEDHWCQELVDQHRTEAYANVPKVDMYGTLQLLATNDLVSHIRQRSQVTTEFLNGLTCLLRTHVITSREETLVFAPAGNDPLRLQHAGDPYTGMLGFFDYCFARFGPTLRDRYRNLVLMPQGQGLTAFATLYRRFWEHDCPLRRDQVPDLQVSASLGLHLREGCKFTKRKELRIYSHFADLIVFEDAIIL